MRPRSACRLCFADGGILELGPRTAVMGVLNVTPDSFSDGGRFEEPPRALAAAVRLAAEGAALIDVGGESTRPGATPVPVDEECRRVLPVIAAIKRELPVRVSIDTTKAEVARRALDAGADLVNDVSALGDPAMLPLVALRRVPVVLMHRRGTSLTMQADTAYADLLREVLEHIEERVRLALAAGLTDGKILVDPGIGFGKSLAGNLTLLHELHRLATIGQPVLVGASRKRFIGQVGGLNDDSGELPVDRRLEGSLAVAAWAAAEGAHMVRAHDVGPTVRIVQMIDAIRSAGTVG